MGDKRIKPIASLKGQLRLGGDKSITHRAIILSSLSKNKVRVRNFYPSQDCLCTLRAMRELGAKIRVNKRNELNIKGVGLDGLSCPASLFLGDSGTTYRLLAGLLSGNKCSIVLKAGETLSRRPMKRIVEPLTKMGAQIRTVNANTPDEIFSPLRIIGGNLKAITYQLPVASAQVKSAILLAALFAKGQTRIIENVKSRDHTERMLARFKADINIADNCISLKGPQERLTAPKTITIPGDFSSAAFFIVGALLLKGSKLTIKGVSVNATRTGLLNVLKRMKADIKIIPRANAKFPAEPVADIKVNYSRLKGTVVESNEIPLLIDEVPILMVAASLAEGLTQIRSVGELRVKETDRISSMSHNLKKMGAIISSSKNANSQDIIIRGVRALGGASLKSFGDHRTAMSMIIAGLCAGSISEIDDTSCINKSFPDFLARLESVKRD